MKREKIETSPALRIVSAGFLGVILLAASCAPARPYRPAPPAPTAPASAGAPAAAPSSGTAGPAGATTSYGQDAVDCERKAALSQVGNKGEAFAACMRARGHTPGR